MLSFIIPLLLVSLGLCSIPGYEMRCIVDNPYERVQILSTTYERTISYGCREEIQNLYFTAVHDNDVDLLESIIKGLPGYKADSLDQLKSEQTCFKYAVENDFFEVAKLLLENSKVFDKLPNVLRYIFKDGKITTLFLLLDEIVGIHDIRNLMKKMMVESLLSAETFLTGGRYSGLLLHSEYLLLQAVEIDSVYLAKQCLSSATSYLFRAYGCPLEKAISKGNPEMIKLLVNHGVSINRRFGGSKTILGYFIHLNFRYAANYEVSEKEKEVIRFFLDEVKIDPFEEYEVQFNYAFYSTTVIGHAILLKNTSLVRFLLGCGISTDSKSFTLNQSLTTYNVEQALNSYGMLDQFQDFFPKSQKL